MATKKQKREAGEARAKVYEAQVREAGLEAQRQANKRRAAIAKRKLDEKQRKQSRMAINAMASVRDCESVE